MEEAEELCPPLSVLASYTENTYNVQQLTEMETLVLNALEWNMTAHVPSPAHFLHYFASQDQVLLLPFNNFVLQFADRFVQLSLYDLPLFEQFDTSLIAASAIHAARCVLQLAPVWPNELQQLTGKTSAQLAHCSSLLQQAHAAHVQTQPNTTTPTTVNESAPTVGI